MSFLDKDIFALLSYNGQDNLQIWKELLFLTKKILEMRGHANEKQCTI